MATRIFAFIIIVVFAWSANDANAQPSHSEMNSCTKPGGCNRATNEMTAVFSEAMLRINRGIDWVGSLVPGDVCQSAFLSQCYPERNPGLPVGENDDTRVR